MATIGNPTTGGSGQRKIYQGFKGISITMPEGGTVTSITVQCENTSGSTGTWAAGVWNSSGTLLGESSTRSDISSNAAYEFTGLSVAVSASTQYIFGVAADGVADNLSDAVIFTNGNTYDGRAAGGDSDNVPLVNVTWGTDSTRDYHISVTYTPASSNWTLAVDAASFDVDGQAITLNKTWSTDVTKADLQPAPASLVLNQSAVLTQADFQPSGQDIVLTWVDNWTLAVDSAAIQPAPQDITLTWTQNWSLAVDQASFQIDGQDVALVLTGAWVLPVDSASFQIDGQDITLTWVDNWTLAVEAAAFSLSGSAVDLTLTTSATERVYSGGWVESAYQKRYAELNDQMRRELEEEQEREELAERLERVLVKEGTLTQAQADLIRLRGLADKYNRDDLPNRARRALAFAERAKSELSAKLALREIRRVEEEEEYAVLLLMALD